MSGTLSHPSPEQLAAFAAGTLGEEEARQIAAHLGSCPLCGTVCERTADTQPWEPPENPPVSPQDATLLRPSMAGAKPPGEGTSGPWPVLEGYEILGEIGRGGMGVVYKAWQKSLGRMVAIKMILGGAVPTPNGGRASARGPGGCPPSAPEHRPGPRRRRAKRSAVFRHGVRLRRLAQGVAGPSPPAAAAGGRAGADPGPGRCSSSTSRTSSTATSSPPTSCSSPPGRGPGAWAARSPPISLFHSPFSLSGRFHSEDHRLRAGQVAVRGRVADPVGRPAGYARVHAARTGGRAGQEAGPAADVYGLGAILYECLTGQPPFQGPSLAETLQQVLHDDPEPPAPSSPACRATWKSSR